jgi:hypothetical protein
MFMMQTPKTFKIGESIDCKINGEPSRMTWKDADTLVIEPGDERAILSTRIDGDLRVFMCSHSGVAAGRYAVEQGPGGVVVSAPFDLFEEEESHDEETYESHEEEAVEEPEEYETAMLFINPTTQEVLPVTLLGYRGIRSEFGKAARIEANALCQLEGDILLSTWGDCNEALIAPGWVHLF